MWRSVPTSAYVEIVASDNATFGDAYQFDPGAPTGPTGGTGPIWNMNGMNFRMDIKAYPDGPTALMSIIGPTGPMQIIVDDPIQRVLHFNVPAVTGPTGTTLAVLIPGKYVYDFVMYDSSTPPVRTLLMHGPFSLRHGITGE